MSDDPGGKQEATEESDDESTELVDQDGTTGGGSEEVSRTTHRILRSAHRQTQRGGLLKFELFYHWCSDFA